MKVQVIRTFRDLKTKKPHKLRAKGTIYSPAKKRAEDLITAGFVRAVEDKNGKPETETK